LNLHFTQQVPGKMGPGIPGQPQMKPGQPIPPGMGKPGLPIQGPGAASSGRLQGMKPGIAPGLPVASKGNQFEENSEVFFTEKQIALGRYCQNHEFLEDIFTQVSVCNALPSSVSTPLLVANCCPPSISLLSKLLAQILEATKADLEVHSSMELFERVTKKRVCALSLSSTKTY